MTGIVILLQGMSEEELQKRERKLRKMLRQVWLLVLPVMLYSSHIPKLCLAHHTMSYIKLVIILLWYSHIKYCLVPNLIFFHCR